MPQVQQEERVLVAPPALGLATRSQFRHEARRLVDSMSEGSGRLVIDLRDTVGLDSVGLNTLIAVRRHALQHRIVVRLQNVCERLRFLLTLTKLDDQFEVE